MSDKTCSAFHEAREKLVGALIKFIQAGNADDRDIEEELQEAKDEAERYI